MPRETRKTDYQTLSLFITLAVLTGLFVFGMKWILLTPATVNPPAAVENASK